MDKDISSSLHHHHQHHHPLPHHSLHNPSTSIQSHHHSLSATFGNDSLNGAGRLNMSPAEAQSQSAAQSQQHHHQHHQQRVAHATSSQAQAPQSAGATTSSSATPVNNHSSTSHHHHSQHQSHSVDDKQAVMHAAVAAAQAVMNHQQQQHQQQQHNAGDTAPGDTNAAAYMDSLSAAGEAREENNGGPYIDPNLNAHHQHRHLGGAKEEKNRQDRESSSRAAQVAANVTGQHHHQQHPQQAIVHANGTGANSEYVTQQPFGLEMFQGHYSVVGATPSHSHNPSTQAPSTHPEDMFQLRPSSSNNQLTASAAAAAVAAAAASNISHHHHHHQQQQHNQANSSSATSQARGAQHQAVARPLKMDQKPEPEQMAGKKRKSSAISNGHGAASLSYSESELRNRAKEQADIPIEQLAEKVRTEENNPDYEKMRQVYGMTWIIKSCVESADANVPRSRIYARYVEMCSATHMKPLNPASFGKLVRIVFPSIKTRRLGVRGQSKYHYCGVRLIDELSQPTGTTPAGTPRHSIASPDLREQLLNNNLDAVAAVGVVGSGISSNGTPSGSGANSPFSRAGTPVPRRGTGVGSDLGFKPTSTGSSASSSRLLDESVFTNTAKEARKFRNMMINDCKHISLPSTTATENFDIPRLQDYLQAELDSDSVVILYGLYKSHCRSLIEALRFMHIKEFLHTIDVFVGNLTRPVQQLLNDGSVREWMIKVDWLTFREMVQLLNPLVLQEVPPPVLNGLRSLAQELVPHVFNSVKGFDSNFVDAKLKPVRAFAGLVDRLLRANEVGQNAGHILSQKNETDHMKQDWNDFIDVESVLRRQLPGGCSERVRQILSIEVTQLLSPDEYGDIYDPENNQFLHSKTGKADVKGDDHIIKWADYLRALPGRFPQIPPRLFLWAMSAINGTVLRDISVNGGGSFGAWWIVICWIEEWLGWTAELNGFLSGGDVSEDDHTQMAKFFNAVDGPGRLEFYAPPSIPPTQSMGNAAASAASSSNSRIGSASSVQQAADDQLLEVTRYMNDE